LNPGEDPRACAIRELREETGCSALNIQHLYTMYTTPGFTDERIHIFMATDLTLGDTAHEADEFLSVETVPMRRALEMIRSGELNDGKTAAGILFAAGFLAS
jgi:ADP-ribose pyrophosphatase